MATYHRFIGAILGAVIFVQGQALPVEDVKFPEAASVYAKPKDAKKKPKIAELSDTTFENDVIKRSNEKPVVVAFYRPSMEACTALLEPYSLASEALDTKMTFTKFDAKKSAKTPTKYGVEVLPTISVFKDGKNVCSFIWSDTDYDLDDEKVKARTGSEKRLASSLEACLK